MVQFVWSGLPILATQQHSNEKNKVSRALVLIGLNKFTHQLICWQIIAVGIGSDCVVFQLQPGLPVHPGLLAACPDKAVPSKEW